MTAISPSRGNFYIEKYNKDIPLYPQKKDIMIRKTNNMDEAFLKIVYEKRIPELRVITKNFPELPYELWCIILNIQLELEKRDSEQYNDWLYSSYSLIVKPGIKLRSRQLYLPNICGIVMNEGLRIIKCGERCLESSGSKKKKIIENLSKYFIKFIVKWYHWLNEITSYHSNNRVATSLKHFIYQLEIKSKYFVNEVEKEKYNENAYTNFYSASYFIHTYYKNYQWNMLTYKDIDFETYIFDNKYYKNVYRKGMLLRNYKRINVFLHK